MDTSVLVVDDDAGFRSLAVRILRGCGFRVIGEASTRASGMAAALDLRPDAVLVDVRLPDGDGIRLGHALAALPWSPRIVLTSSDNDAAGEVAASDGGLLPFVPKDQLPTAPLLRLLAID
ncbi:MAG TPA: response regulator [Baekduia sp.]|uniref:response regulator n=1 Tax=Baekduia sp. TaxID=2600305 RepID=UPI002B7B0740|nr:response regulator [Baekduia sp.]HMJ32542.1 response regulator [Baekduia sp.]